MTHLPESPLERAKRLSREMVSVDELAGITERVPVVTRTPKRVGDVELLGDGRIVKVRGG